MRRVRVVGGVAAPPARVYAILIDYREEHPLILPSRYFRRLEIEKGGIGAGTRLRVTMRVLGRTRVVRLAVLEPEPGRVLVESDVDGAAATTFTVDPEEGGAAARVTIETAFDVKRGLAGAIEGVIAAWILTRIYTQELALLARRAETV